MKAFRPPLVEVSWLDATTYTAQWLVADVPHKAKLQERKTSGYLLHNDCEGKLILASTYDIDDDDPSVCDVTVIPRKWVTEVTRMRRAKKRGE